MKTAYGHLSYCTNIHPSNNWTEHFDAIKKSVPVIKNKISPSKPFGIGLRLSNSDCNDLMEAPALNAFKAWLLMNDCYVFTLNGFVYGHFHQNAVKENVYTPDWTTDERVDYTLKLFDLLKELLPEGMEGSLSTAPLSYRHGFKNIDESCVAFEKCTRNILKVVEHLINIRQTTGKILHLNIEPEPDGLLENVFEFIEWYNHTFLPTGIKGNIKTLLQQHLRLCFDVCHSALAYEQIKEVSATLNKNNILIGKVQISSALKIDLTHNRSQKIKNLSRFNEPIYLHQVIAKDAQNRLYKFKDIPEALMPLMDEKYTECRVHFHVPVFSEHYDEFTSTQKNIIQTLFAHNRKSITNHWEVETYTWNILPHEFQLPINESITRELEWVLKEMNTASDTDA